MIVKEGLCTNLLRMRAKAKMILKEGLCTNQYGKFLYGFFVCDFLRFIKDESVSQNDS